MIAVPYVTTKVVSSSLLRNDDLLLFNWVKNNPEVSAPLVTIQLY